jgi:hypothetical protein
MYMSSALPDTHNMYNVHTQALYLVRDLKLWLAVQLLLVTRVPGGS